MQFTTALMIVAILICVALMVAFPMVFFVWIPGGLVLLTVIAFAWFCLRSYPSRNPEHRERQQPRTGIVQQP